MTDLESSYRHCERVCRQSGSNFYRTFGLLRNDKRRAMYALYAFARLADDATDESNEAPKWNVDAWLDWLARIDSIGLDRSLPLDLPVRVQEIGPALADSMQRFRIPVEMLREVVLGVDMDTRPTEIRSWEDLRGYCFRVASAVGICCTAIWSSGHPLLPDHPRWQSAIDCGLAFQLTNILRDIREDALRGRVYLPTEDLSRFGITRQAWLDRVGNPTSNALAELGDWRGLLEVQFERAEALFDRGWRVHECLELDGLRMFSWMWHTYRSLLRQLQQRPRGLFESRQRLPIRTKLALGASHLFTPGFSRLLRANAWLQHSFRNELQSEQLAAPKLRDGQPRVAVIGGGLAGINAALHLARHGCRVTLLEAKSRLGGRAGSFLDTTTGVPIDYCQHVGMKCCTELQRWIDTTGQTHAWRTEDTLHFVSRTGKRIAVRGWPLPAPFHLSGLILAWPDLSPSERVRIALGLGALLRTKNTPEFEKQPAVEWLKSHFQNEQTLRNYWATILVSALGEQIDRVAMGPVRKVLIDGFAATRDAYHLLVPKQPLSVLVDATSREKLETLQVEIQSSNSITQLRRSPRGSWQLIGSRTAMPSDPSQELELEVDAIVVAVPWHRVSHLLSESVQALDSEEQNRLRAVENLGTSPITGVHTWWDRPWLNRPHAILIDRLCQWVFPGPESHHATANVGASTKETYYQVVISGSRLLPHGDPSAVLAAVQKDLAEVFPEAAGARLVRGRVVTDPQSVFSVAPGHESGRLPQHCFGNQGLFLAGDWTDTGWPATMEGALRSGLMATEGVLAYFHRPARLLIDRPPSKPANSTDALPADPGSNRLNRRR